MKHDTERAYRMEVMGHLDGIQDDCAHGWAIYPADVASTVVVEVMCQGRVVARGQADRFRQDLADARIGNGHHHFVLPLSYELHEGETHELTARDALTATPLQGSAEYESRLPRPHPALISRDIGLRHIGQTLSVGATARRNALRAYVFCSLLQETGNYSLARSSYASFQRKYPGLPLLQCKIAETWLLEGQRGRAKDEYIDTIARNPGYAQAYVGLAHALQLSGDFLEAEDTLLTARDLEPEDVQTRLCLREIRRLCAIERVQKLYAGGEPELADAKLREYLLCVPEAFSPNTLLPALLLQTAAEGTTNPVIASHTTATVLLERTMAALAARGRNARS